MKDHAVAPAWRKEDQSAWVDENPEIARLVAKMREIDADARPGELEARSTEIVHSISAHPLSPHRGNVKAIVDELIEIIDVMRGETWRELIRLAIRDVCKNEI